MTMHRMIHNAHHRNEDCEARGRETDMGRYAPGIKTIVIIMSMMLLIGPLSVFAVFRGDVELLRTVAMQNKANNEAIVTWKGEAVIHDVDTMTDGYHREIERTVSFAYGRVEGSVRWNMEIRGIRCFIGGKDVSDLEIGSYSGMFKDKRFYRYRIPQREKHHKWHHLVIFDRKVARGQELSRNFDPTYFLKDHGENVADRLMGLYKLAKRSKLKKWSISRKGDLVTLEARFGKGNGNINRYVFDISKGGSMVSYYGKDSTNEENWAYGFEKMDGVWVLKQLDRRHTYKNKHGVKVTRTKKIKWKKNIINKPLDANEFSLGRLGIKPGDWVHDTLAKVNFRYREAAAGEKALPGEIGK